jgi:phage terminase large subunit-like protein
MACSQVSLVQKFIQRQATGNKDASCSVKPSNKSCSRKLLSQECKVYRDAIEVPRHGAVYRVLSSDGKLQQGLNPSLVIFDELHVQPNDDLWDALTLGSGARLDPLAVAITTAGFDLDSLAGRLYNYGKSVAANEIQDDSFGFYWWEANQSAT